MNDQDYTIFETYLSGDLSNDESQAFEVRLEQEPSFKTAFETYKELSGFLNHEIGNETKNQEFKDNLKAISNSYFENQTGATSVKRFNFYKYAIAACVVLLLGYFVFNQFSRPVYGDYAHYGNVSLTVRSDNNTLFTKAENAFNSKQYDEAKTLFNTILETDPSNLEIQLYNAIALIETDQYSQADALLKSISETNSAYKNKAIWYWALSKLKQKEYKKCADLLKTLPKDAEDYQQAQKLLKKLE